MEESHKTSARDLLRLDDLDGARRIADAEIEAWARQGRPRGAWPHHLILFEVQRLQGRTEQALNEMDRLEKVDPPDAKDIESWIGITKLRGYYHGLLGRYESSQQLLQEAEAMAFNANLLELRAEVHLCQAMIFYLQQNYPLSDRIFRVVLSLSQQVGGWYFRGAALWGIGKNLMIQRRYEEAIPWLQQSLAIFEGVGARLLVAVAWSELAVCHLGLGNDGLALDLLRRAETVEHAARTVANYQVTLANIGNVYLYRGDHLVAISYYKRALALAREIKDPVAIRKWSYNINLAYARLRRIIDSGAQEASSVKTTVASIR